MQVKTDITAVLSSLEDSTTLFLESKGNAEINIGIVSQEEIQTINGVMIMRSSVLYFHSPLKPLIYSTSVIKRDHLKEEEYKLLTSTRMPFGKIFLQENRTAMIFKRNISVSAAEDAAAAKHLDVGGLPFYRKQYDFWVDNREIGCIIEFFNQKSLNRL